MHIASPTAKVTPLGVGKGGRHMSTHMGRQSTPGAHSEVEYRSTPIGTRNYVPRNGARPQPLDLARVDVHCRRMAR